jgi:Spy/CpxP family protein refolding chaperone
MLGIAFGFFCLFALIAIVRRGRYARRHGRGYGYGRWMLRGLFRRLNTGPGQEKVVLGEIETLRDTARGLRQELKATRADIAAIVREPVFDRAKVDALFRKQDELIGSLRTAIAGSVERVHEALDDRQKADLADLLERNFYYHGGYGRHAC